jgi:hypothetical protein
MIKNVYPTPARTPAITKVLVMAIRICDPDVEEKNASR